MSFMSILSTPFAYLLPFIVALTIIVFIHELGHFLVARWCGVKVEVFSIGFGSEIVGPVSAVDASHVKRLDTAGALEILQLAGGSEANITAAGQGHADLFKVVKENMREPPKPQHVDFLTHWLEELGLAQAVWVLDVSQDMLHYSPEPRIVQAVKAAAAQMSSSSALA